MRCFASGSRISFDAGATWQTATATGRTWVGAGLWVRADAKICGNAAAANVAECLHATYACLGSDGRPTELWVFYDRGEGDGAWKVRYFGAHAHTAPSQGSI